MRKTRGPTRLLRWGLLALLGWLLAAPLPALAHGGTTAAAQRYTQALGAYEVTVRLQPTPRVPGPLAITVWLSGQSPPPLQLRAAPAASWPSAANQALIRPVPGDRGPYDVVLQVDRAGPWELEIQLAGAGQAGAAQASIPFRVVAPGGDPAAWWRTGALAAGGLLVLLSALAGLSGGPAALRVGVAWAAATGALVCLTVGLTLAAQQSLAPPGAAAADGAPHVNAALRLDPALPEAGRPLTIDLALTDGASGQPVDDLAPHHDALVHLIVVSADGAFFAHVHPARVGAGRYRITLTPERAGRHLAAIEIARRGGAQLITRSFSVSGGAGPPAAPPPGLGPRTIDGLTITARSTRTPIRAGEPQTLSLEVRAGGEPVTAIEPWLGMGGHMIVIADDGATIGHLHAIDALHAAPETRRYGPTLRFAYSFPAPGRYRLWAQFQHAGRVVTVPLELVIE